jgi:MarR family transcriptional regulator, transcriptional regulator for hemolysin
MSTDYKPLGYTLIALTKYYLSILGDKLSGIPIEKYFYPFWFITQHSGHLSQQQMAESLDIDKVAVVRIVDYLEKKGFVQRVNDLEDRRCYRLHVTAIGEKYAPIIEQALKETDEIFLDELSGQGHLWHSELLQLLKKLKSGSNNNISIDYDKIQNNEN